MPLIFNAKSAKQPKNKRRANRKSGKARAKNSTRNSVRPSIVVARTSIPVARGLSVRGARMKHVDLVSGSEPLGQLQITSSTKTGDLLAEMLVNPRILPAPMLNTKSSMWSFYKFKKLEFEFVSFFPSTAVGGICYGVTRDVDVDFPDALMFAKSSEVSLNSSLATPQHRLVVDCSDRYNKQRYYDTQSNEASDFAQFKLIVAMSQALSGIALTNPVGIDIICHYTVEFCGPVAPPYVGNKLTSFTVNADSSVTTNITGVKVGQVYLINPAISENGFTPILAMAIGNSGKAYGYPSITAAYADSGEIVDEGGVYPITCDTYVYYHGSRGRPKGSAPLRQTTISAQEIAQPKSETAAQVVGTVLEAVLGRVEHLG